jgi:hypothetical protein
MKILSLRALKAAIATFKGARFVEGKSYCHYQGRGGARATPAMMEADKRDVLSHHCIEIEGCNYSVGVKQRTDGSYSLLFDHWGDGYKLTKAFGPQMGLLAQQYAKCAIKQKAESLGHIVQVTQAKGSDKLKMTITV